LESCGVCWKKLELSTKKTLTPIDCPACRRQAGQKSASRIPTHGSSPPSADKPAKILFIKGGRQFFLLNNELFLRA
jgi:hypothetical protein